MPLWTFVRRFMRALSLSALSLFVMMTPQGLVMFGWRWGSMLARILDAPISLLSQLLPWPLRSGLASQFSNSGYCFPNADDPAHYVIVGTIAWLIVFYTFAFAVALFRRSVRTGPGAVVR